MTMIEIAREVAKKHRLTVDQLRSMEHRLAFAPARQEAMALMREAGKGWSQIGRFMNRTHATVIYAVKRYGERCSQENQFPGGEPARVADDHTEQGRIAA